MYQKRWPKSSATFGGNVCGRHCSSCISPSFLLSAFILLKTRPNLRRHTKTCEEMNCREMNAWGAAMMKETARLSAWQSARPQRCSNLPAQIVLRDDGRRAYPFQREDQTTSAQAIRMCNRKLYKGEISPCIQIFQRCVCLIRTCEYK